MRSNPGAIRVFAGLAGALTFLSVADAGTFSVKVLEKNGTSMVNQETLELHVFNSAGTEIQKLTTTNGWFPTNMTTFGVNASSLPADKTLKFEIWRNGGTTKSIIENLNGASPQNQSIHATIAP